jgi:nitrate reductase NapE component
MTAQETSPPPTHGNGSGSSSRKVLRMLAWIAGLALIVPVVVWVGQVIMEVVSYRQLTSFHDAVQSFKAPATLIRISLLLVVVGLWPSIIVKVVGAHKGYTKERVDALLRRRWHFAIAFLLIELLIVQDLLPKVILLLLNN